MNRNGGGDTQVLVVGAGPAGLVLALLLGRQGIPTLLVERRSGTSVLPRATGINLRSMEIFRSLGLDRAITEASMDVRGKPLWVELETLRGPARAERHIDAPSGVPRTGFPSPAAHLQCAQDRLEPLLLSAVRALPECEVRFDTELVSLEQESDGVTAILLDRLNQKRREVAASYLVAADGANSIVRSALGIPMEGQEHLGRELTILFSADLSSLVTGHQASLYRVHNAAMQGTFRPVDEATRWTLTTPSTGDGSEGRCVEVIRAGSGDSGIEPEILAVQEWELGAATAARFGEGRVLLVGDAAHRTTPGGAMGMNTAVQDSHNLAWKLAGVIRGWAGAELIASYEAERRPVASRNVALSLEIWNDMSRAGRTVGAVLGFSYESEAVIPDGTPPPVVADPDVEFVPTARPGSRAPHCWVDLNGRRISTLDLFDGRFVLLSQSSAWASAARAGAELGVPLVTYTIDDPDWAALYGVAPRGAVLVRPDGHVGWRTRGSCIPEPDELGRALRRLLALPDRDGLDTSAVASASN